MLAISSATCACRAGISGVGSSSTISLLILADASVLPTLLAAVARVSIRLAVSWLMLMVLSLCLGDGQKPARLKASR
ncbi:hypothetical protein D3C71_1882210 [compost metagenome]